MSMYPSPLVAGRVYHSGESQSPMLRDLVLPIHRASTILSRITGTTLPDLSQVRVSCLHRRLSIGCPPVGRSKLRDRYAVAVVDRLLTRNNVAKSHNQRLGAIRRRLAALPCVFLALDFRFPNRCRPVQYLGELSFRFEIVQPADRSAFHVFAQCPVCFSFGVHKPLTVDGPAAGVELPKPESPCRPDATQSCSRCGSRRPRRSEGVRSVSIGLTFARLDPAGRVRRRPAFLVQSRRSALRLRFRPLRDRQRRCPPGYTTFSNVRSPVGSDRPSRLQSVPD